MSYEYEQLRLQRSTAFHPLLGADGIMVVAAALSAALSAIGVAYSTPRPNMLYTSSRPLSPAPLPEFRRTDADLFEGVHSEASQPLTQRVLERGMPRSGRGTPQ